jgi:hypothetical protein
LKKKRRTPPVGVQGTFLVLGLGVLSLEDLLDLEDLEDLDLAMGDVEESEVMGVLLVVVWGQKR